MKRKAFLNIVLFCGLLILINLFSNIIYKRVVMGDTVVMRTQNQFEEFGYNIDVLILGDSHPQHALNTTIIKNSFNYTTAAETYILTYYKLKYILTHKQKKINVVTLNIDPHSFTTGRSNRLPIPFNYYYASFIDYLELGKRKKKVLPYLEECIKGRFFSFVGNRKDLYNKIIGKEKNFPLINGYIRSRRDYSKMEREKMAAGRTRNQFFRNRYFDPDMVFYFKKILELCNEEGINVILIKMPLTEEYYSHVKKYMDIDQFYQQVNSAIGNQPNIILLDAQKDYFQHPDFFGDCDHLNERGAEKLSERIVRIVSSI